MPAPLSCSRTPPPAPNKTTSPALFRRALRAEPAHIPRPLLQPPHGADPPLPRQPLPAAAARGARAVLCSDYLCPHPLTNCSNSPAPHERLHRPVPVELCAPSQLTPPCYTNHLTGRSPLPRRPLPAAVAPGACAVLSALTAICPHRLLSLTNFPPPARRQRLHRPRFPVELCAAVSSQSSLTLAHDNHSHGPRVTAASADLFQLPASLVLGQTT